MTIGSLADHVGVKTSAIRYYERQGLLAARRNPANYRVYDQEDLLRMQLILGSKKLGFSLAKIRSFLETLFRPDMTLGDLDGIIADKIQEIESRIQELQATKDNLVSLIHNCPLHERLLDQL
jgi:DNA-binding transcriptional MerR regulator